MAMAISPSSSSSGFPSRLRCLSQPSASTLTELAFSTVFNYRESRLRTSLSLGGGGGVVVVGAELLLQQKQKLRQYSAIMASSDGQVTLPLSHAHAQWTELNEESDFVSLLSPDGYLSICGFGSLLSERSARSTFPDLVNFRVAKLNGFRRVFAHAAPIFFERGIANPETGEISSLSVEPCEGETLIVTVFEIKRSEIPSFIEREQEFRFLAVVPETLDGITFASPGVLCARYGDEEYFRVRLKDVHQVYSGPYPFDNLNAVTDRDMTNPSQTIPSQSFSNNCNGGLFIVSDSLTLVSNLQDHVFALSIEA
ncbi:uncharacterized protein LOC122062150 isoform X4 [Macadamia integrifolia]|uniref:uncharacterized protein LOC122062150 isoform X4 n=1 Tax=Macadamia integrifolia TaxID=60698 RepID=UPI001C533436|nr:uncharacterized protein LOC122062150 isoform X4 [Macadamia integrifolia]